jgi:hypothetical protein
LEREIALKRAEREQLIDGAFDRGWRTVSVRRSPLARLLDGRLAVTLQSLRRLKPLASS